jgi:hypothetical protein
VGKAMALEEMYLIYQTFRNYLTDAESWGEGGLEDRVGSYRSFWWDVPGICARRVDGPG